MARESHADQALNVPPGRNDIPYPTKLELVRSILGHMSECAAGSVAGTGAALDVDTPFDPAVVFVFNEDTPGWLLHTPSMAAGEAIKTVAAGTLSFIATNGITLGAKKFTIGTDATNGNGNTLHWLAWGFRDSDGSV